MAGISLKGISKRYGAIEVIEGIDLDIRDGEFIVFVGPSGCGKSTLLRMIAGLEDISGGALHIGDDLVNGTPPKERGIAMVFQSYAIFPHMTVRENVAFGLTIAGASKVEKEAKVAEAARMLQIEHLLDRRPSQLSGGQRQRVAIGRAIVRDPKVFLFDEPLSNLDAALRVDTRIEIANLHKSLKATMLYVTHDQVEAMTLADRIVVLNRGVIQQVGTPMELYRNPANLFVAGFIGSPKMNFADGVVTNCQPGTLEVDTTIFGKVVLPVGAAALVAGEKVTIGLRPHHFDILDSGGTEGVITVVERLGNETTTIAELPGGQKLTINVDPLSEVTSDQKLNFAPQLHHAAVFDANGLSIGGSIN
ncbi:ABC transporter ATP-binding protein [Agrobacterium sp. NPDC089420]|uniref:ABC transporter ATP-binding protein n=1 Tax=Agrobacterium sp. NPDC089420 TaxID=3363918 RepID=UPI00384A96E0